MLGQVRRLSPVGLVALGLTLGCGRERARETGAAGGREAPAADPLLSAALPGGATRVAGNQFHVDVAALPGCTTSAPCAVIADLTATDGFKVNTEYPTRFVAAPGLDATATFAVTGVHTGRLIVRFPRPASTPARIAGELKLSVCDPDRCLIETAALAATVP